MFLFGTALARWAEAKIKRLGGKRKSISLPAGGVGFRHSKPLLVVDDDQQVIVWAKAHCPAAIILTERLSKAALNEHLVTTGEMPVHGAHIEPEREHFYIR